MISHGKGKREQALQASSASKLCSKLAAQVKKKKKQKPRDPD